MKQCAFTIVAKNYIGLGQILGKSLRAHNPEIDFRIYVADEFEQIPDNLPGDVVMAKDVIKDISKEQWTDMTFKYDLTEFCTSIKPFCFEHVFDDGFDKAYYFDPDIYMFSSIDEISSSLDNHSMTLTPQIAGIHTNYTGEHPEWAMNVNGIFNLGFCGIRNNQWGNLVVQWWKERLRDHAFADRSVGEFTDQKWMDWIPAFLGDELFVQKSLGMNMAPWNFFERKAYESPDGQWRVTFRNDDVPQRDDALVFIHFAGYDYSQLKKGIVARKRIENLLEYADITAVSGVYRDAIVKNAAVFDSFIMQKYSYSTYDNAEKIAAFHRRLYHGFNRTIANPFSTGKGSFYESLKKKGMIVTENIDNVSRRTVNNMEGKKKMIAYLYKGLYRLMGYKRYVMFLKSLYFYCRPEMHTFLLKHEEKQPNN